MNPHYHRYAELSSPHPPSPDNNNYPQMGGGGHHHNGHGPTMNPIEGHQQGFHHLNNNNLPIKQCAGCAGNVNTFCCKELWLNFIFDFSSLFFQ